MRVTPPVVSESWRLSSTCRSCRPGERPSRISVSSVPPATRSTAADALDRAGLGAGRSRGDVGVGEQGIPPRRLDHVTLMASDVTEQKVLFEQTLGFGTRETVVDGPVEVGAWMSVDAPGHELAVMRRRSSSSTAPRRRPTRSARWRRGRAPRSRG